MPIIVKMQTEYELAPEGLHAATCISVDDLGIEETHYGDKHKIRVTWELTSGETIARKYTLSMNEKAYLRKDLRTWRGRDLNDAEKAVGFDVETMIGVPATIQVEHVTRDDKTYANVIAVMASAVGIVAKPPEPETFEEIELPKSKSKPAEPAPTAKLTGTATGVEALDDGYQVTLADGNSVWMSSAGVFATAAGMIGKNATYTLAITEAGADCVKVEAA